MEEQEGAPRLTAEEPGATAKEAEAVAGTGAKEVARGGDGLGEKGRAGNSGSNAKGDIQAGGVGDCESDAKGGGEASKAGDSGSDAKGSGEAGGAGDSGSYAKGGSEASRAGDSGSDAKGGSEASRTGDSGSDAKGGSEASRAGDSGRDAKGGGEAEGAGDSGRDAKGGGEAGGAGDSGRDAKGDGEAEGAGDSGRDAKGDGEAEGAGDSGAGAEERAEGGKRTGAEEREAVGGSGLEPQDGAGGAEPEMQEAEAERTNGAVAREGHGGSTSEEPLSPEMGGEEEEWDEPAPSSPDEGLASPTGDAAFGKETGASQPGGTSQGREAAPGGSTSTEGTAQQDSVQSPAPEGVAPPKEKPKRPALDRRELTRPRLAPRAQSRKDLVEKFGGAASGPAPNIKKTGGANTIKNMLLEWCRAKTRGYEHVDIQNFSSSWSSGLAFCALVHKFFPDAFDYTALDPANRRENFALAFATAEKHADCAPLLEVEDMVRMSVPDSKCVYTYIQELYRSLVDKGLVKTKKK
ncbi:smoothelin-like protein 1 isoform X2 [Gopherus flavomarginatus]|uniref:smoothelin-like protein 1 isoform X2 n=1 Tax=Gopherus flavomarginatus TaxID=286002 RepID=UPI0021CC2784|nr:smoothelin-like protein 1 isoform X2 [Gopherus flavomarginatus]